MYIKNVNIDILIFINSLLKIFDLLIKIFDNEILNFTQDRFFIKLTLLES